MGDLSTFFTELPTLAQPVGRGDYRFHDPDGKPIGFAQFIPAGSRSVKLHRLFSYTVGKGHGSTMLRALCDLADRHNVELLINALPFGSKPYRRTREQLVEWYTRHGFVGKPKQMSREPRGEGAEAAQVAAPQATTPERKLSFLFRIFGLARHA